MAEPQDSGMMLDREPPDRLRQLVDPSATEGRAAHALQALIRTGPEEARKLSAELLVDKRFDANARAVAAVELGRVASPEHEAALMKAMGQAEPDVLRHVLKAMGRVGGERALDLLARWEPPASPPVVEALSAARTLLSYRTGSTRFLLKPPAEAELRPPSPESAIALPIRVLGLKRVEPLLADVRRELPATELSARTGLAVTCGSEYRILLSEHLGTDPEALLRRPLVAGAILKYRPCPEHFSLDAYLLANPAAEDSSAIFAMRPSGRVVIAGEARATGDVIVFGASTTRTHHFRRLRVTGELRADGAFRGVEALVSRDLAASDPRRRPQARRPLQAITPSL